METGPRDARPRPGHLALTGGVLHHVVVDVGSRTSASRTAASMFLRDARPARVSKHRTFPVLEHQQPALLGSQAFRAQFTDLHRVNSENPGVGPRELMLPCCRSAFLEREVQAAAGVQVAGFGSAVRPCRRTPRSSRRRTPKQVPWRCCVDAALTSSPPRQSRGGVAGHFLYAAGGADLPVDLSVNFWLYPPNRPRPLLFGSGPARSPGLIMSMLGNRIVGRRKRRGQPRGRPVGISPSASRRQRWLVVPPRKRFQNVAGARLLRSCRNPAMSGSYNARYFSQLSKNATVRGNLWRVRAEI